MISVVIPAHNEAAVIERCVRAICEGQRPDELEIIVVANGCSDDTAGRAAGLGDAVRVVELAEASKSAALARGDAEARGFPRFFVDADVVLPLASLRKVAEVLESGQALAAAPRLRVDTTHSSAAVRAYYRIWTRLPYHRSGMIGSGVYALSRAGRARFETFPDLISDDGFVRLHFRDGERVSVPDSEFVITAPRRLRELVEIKTRSQKGWVQLQRACPELLVNDPRDYGSPLREFLRRPGAWPAIAVYAYVHARTRLRALRLNRSGDLGRWERDESSRPAIENAAPLGGGDVHRDG